MELLRDLPQDIRVDHCCEDDGELRLAVTAVDLGGDVEKGDRLNAGFYLTHSDAGPPEVLACERVYRVACENGYLIECEKGQGTVVSAEDSQWREKIATVVSRSFSTAGLDEDPARFRATVRQMLTTPYELLCNLVAQGIISEDEQCDIQCEFDRAGDWTLYGLINAVTSVARRLREDDGWKRSFELERLGGEILRGDHQPPVLAPVFA
ncbi:MAG: hypothetical protein KY475_10170 [Planctomycetes bacterium]|nr:hypothetical protein [Planctomycetota bacterium]